MTRPHLPYLQKERTRHGALVWYVRKGGGPRVRIREDYGTPEFMRAYQAAIAASSEPALPQRGAGAANSSLQWLIDRYHDSGAWAHLSAATRRQRENIFKQVCKTAGDAPFASITTKTILEGRDRRRQTPFAANDFLKAMRGLFRWAFDAQHVAIDPTAGAARCKVPRTDGYRVWSEEEIERFEAYWPIGTRERLALAILLYTGLRRGDAVRLGRQHVADGLIKIRTEKCDVQIIIPILPELAEIIAAARTGDLAFIATVHGTPMTKDSFGQWFTRACRAAGVPGSAHGLRKAGATRAVENGATLAELNAIYGWTGEKMASLYTRSMDRAKSGEEGDDEAQKE